MTGFYITVKNGLLDPKHIKKMKGDMGWGTVWLFLWFLDKMTIIDDEIGEGKVLGGKPVKFEDVSKDIGISRATYKRWLSLLTDEGYIKTTRTPYGLTVIVYKAFKVFGQKADGSSMSQPKKRDGSHKSHLTDRSVSHLSQAYREPSNKTIQLDNTVDTNITNVILGENPPSNAVDKRNPEIQEGIDLLKQLYGAITKENLNRYALKRLYTAKGKERVLKAIQFAYQMREDQYCPGVFNYMDLEEKWHNLETYAVKLTKERTKESKIAVYSEKL